jgi:prophage antirepressor-like protein
MDKLNEIILKYSNTRLIVIFDENKKPWFNAVHISKILKYSKPRDVVRKLVDNEYIKSLKNLVLDYTQYNKTHPKTLFINESGVYALLLRSKKKTAKKFYKWVIEKVLPSIREKGYYELEKKYKDQINEFNNNIKTLIKEHNKDKKKLIERIKVLENNQAKKHITEGKFIYIIKPADGKPITMNKTEILKMGKTKKFNARLGTINTPFKDDVYVLYKVKVDDITAVENCLKGMLSKQLYRSNREHYIITLKEAINMIKKCIKLTKSKLIQEDKLYENHINKTYKKNIKKLSRSTTKIEDQKIDFILDNNKSENESENKIENKSNSESKSKNNSECESEIKSESESEIESESESESEKKNKIESENENESESKNESESESKNNKKEQKGGYILDNYNYIYKLYKYNKKIFNIIEKFAK